MAISPSLSTVEVIVASTGALPNGEPNVTLRVTARTTANVAPAGPTQVRVTPLTGGAILYVNHEHVRPSFPEIAFSYSNALGVADITLGSLSEVTTRYLVEIGEDDGRINYTENGQIDKPERDFPVGPQLAFVRTFGAAQTIDEAWLIANNTDPGTGVTSRVVRQTLFAAGATLAVTPATGQLPSIFFSNCIFATSPLINYTLTTNNIRFEAQHCAFRGAGVATVNGEGGKYTRCVWDTTGRDAVRIEQGGTSISSTGLPDDFTQTTFLSCLFRRIGIVTPGYCVRGTPMRNVIFDHCWFDVAHALSALPQSNPSGSIIPYGSCIGAIYQSTEIDGARGPRIYGCWLGGGEDAIVTWDNGASAMAPQFGALRANRFDLRRAAPGAVYLIDEMSTSAVPATQGNMADEDGRLIDNDDHPGVNRTAGALFLWPQVALETQPEVEWTNGVVDPPDPPGGGSGGGTSGEVGGPSLGEDLIFTVRNGLDTPVGGGGGGNVITARPIPGTIVPAEPVLVGSDPIPPDQPLIVEWDTASSNLQEGGSEVILARLFTAQGTTPTNAQLDGFAVPLTVAYTGAGSAAGDFVIPAAATFAMGASVASVVIEAVDDVDTEGAEVATITLNVLTGLNTAGETVVKVNPGDQDDHAVTILANDTPGVVTVFMGLLAHTLDEGSAANTVLQIPVRISGNPSGPVPVRVTFTGTANMSGVATPADYAVSNPKLPGSPNVVPLTFQPGGPTQINLDLTIIGDTTFEPDETIVMTLTCQAAASVAVAAGSPNNVCTVTIEDDDVDPGMDPQIEWVETDLTLREVVIGPGGVPQAVNRVVDIRCTLAGNPFSEPTDVSVEIMPIGQFPAYFAGTGPQGENDYDLLFEPPNAGTITGGAGGVLVGIVPFAAGQVVRSIVIQVENDNTPENAQGEQFRLRILDGAGYTVRADRRDLNVTLLDPLGGDTTLLTPRLTGLARSIVSTSIPLVSGVTTAAGFTMEAPGGDVSTCQWHPLSYKADGTPADVRLWAMLSGAAASVPGQTNAVIVRGGSTSAPTGLIDVAAQYATAVGNNLRLTLVHNVNGETRDFELRVAAPLLEVLSVDTGSGTTQGGGPRLFTRRTIGGPLRASNTVPGGSCTMARMHIDCRADVNAVAVAINWGNYRWRKPTTGAGHKVANDYVDGEVFFESLNLNGIPAGWAAVVLDPRTTVSDYDAAGSRVRIIKPLAGTARHYLPPLRGHIAYVVLYETATVSAATAREILDGYDMGYAFGGLGIDRNDFVGELGHQVMNYGEGQIPFRDNHNFGTTWPQGLAGWPGCANFAQRDLIRIEGHLAVGTADVGGVAVAQHWWHPFSFPDGGSPSGERINISGAVYPSKWRRRRTMFELVHLWQRVGGVAWNENGADVTDEDFCVDSGPNLLSAVATWMGIGGQRMGHHHFYVPDYLVTGAGAVSPDVKIGPGRQRATGTINLSAQPTAGDQVVIDDGNGAVFTFRFGTGSDTGTLKHVAIGAATSDTVRALSLTIRAFSSPTAFRVWASLTSPTINLTHRYHGTQGNATVTKTGATITVTGMAGGSNGTNVRLWNYLVPGSNTCIEDMHLNWFAKPMEGDYSYHSFDWPHMSRMHEAVREGWWCFFDPIAHDCATGLMHLGTQCLMRYPEAREAESVYVGSGGISQLFSHATAANLALIREAIQGQYLRHFIQRNFDTSHPAAQFSARVAASGGLNNGTWRTRNPQVPSALYHPGSPSPFNPLTASDFQFNSSQQWVIDRGWGWLMAAVARGYAIDGVLRPTATKDLHRTRLHPGINTEGAVRPSWFELVRYAIQNTMHASGAASSQDINSTAGLYTIQALDPVTGQQVTYPPDFSTRTGSLPGGEQNVPVTGSGSFGDDEWYANYIAWHANYVAMGAYAINRRVYSWCDRDTVPNVQLQTNPWAFRLRGLWDFGRLLYLAAAARFGPQHFFIPTFHVVGVGDPATVGLATSLGQFGRFNSEAGAANPQLTFRTDDVLWWSYSTPLGSQGLNHYNIQYLMWSWMFGRMFRTSVTVPGGSVGEMLDIQGGLTGDGGGTVVQNAPGTVATLMEEWRVIRVNQPTESSGDEYGWAVQWHRNELGAP